MMEYKLLHHHSKFEDDDDDDDETETTSSSSTATTTIIPSHHFLGDAVFAGGSFWSVESAFGRIHGVIKTVTGYCGGGGGGSLTKPTYTQVFEGRTGHTEAVKVTYDKTKISYTSLCNAFWDTHDPTDKHFLNFGISTHQRSAIFYSTEEERKEALESKIRRQMKLNRRIITKIVPLSGTATEGSDEKLMFFDAENKHQKYYLQKHCWVCHSLNLRTTAHFAGSILATKLNGILGMDGEQTIIRELAIFLRTNKLTNQTKSACEDIIEDLKKKK